LIVATPIFYPIRIVEAAGSAIFNLCNNTVYDHAYKSDREANPKRDMNPHRSREPDHSGES
jgi:hypothetical protein